MIAVLAALERELKPVISRLAAADHGQTTAMSYWSGMYDGIDAAAVLTGVGPQQAEAATEAVIEQLRPQLIVSVGYAGGLADALEPGALVVAEGAIHNGERVAVASAHVERVTGLLAGAEIPHERGWLLTVDKPLATPESKAAAHEQWGAVAVEMETAQVIGAANRAGVPCVAVRAVSDTVGQVLHVGGKCVLSQCGVGPLLRLALHLTRHPREAAHAIRLHRQGALCSRRLAAAVDAVLRGWAATPARAAVGARR